jgi:hypothetical protein
MQSTPLTLVISPQGRVLHSWAGAWVGRTLEEVEAALDVKLPGMTE